VSAFPYGTRCLPKGGLRALGTAQDKKHILYEGGYVPGLLPLMKETLNWLDHLSGPVK
jgi:hypothetical protein